jgi:hypothetical protein
MYRSLAELNNFEIGAITVGAVCLVLLLILTRRLTPLLWAILLAAVAGTVLFSPDSLNYCIIGGCVAAMVLLLVSEIRTRRREATFRKEFDRLSLAVSDLQNRNILAEVRVASALRGPSGEDVEP